MSTPVIPAVTRPESASGNVNETQEVSLQERLNAATEEEYKTWERTGDIPPVKPKSETPPPKIEAPAAAKEEKAAPEKKDAKESSAVEGEVIPPKTESAAAPEAARQPQRKRDADGRVAQLLKERKEQDEKWAARFDALEKKLAPPAEASAQQPGSQPAADGKETKASEAEPELGGVNSKTGKPYQTVAEWQKEHSSWLRAQILAEVNGTLSKSEQQRKEAEDKQVLDQALNDKFEAGRKKYPDFKEVALGNHVLIPIGSATDVFIRNSENAGEMAYYLGQHPEITAKFYRANIGKDGNIVGAWENSIPPSLQMIELARIEAKLTGTPAVPATSSAAVVINPPAAPPKNLPPPPTVLSARSNAGTDPVEEALHKKSFADYEKAANASERKARRG